jgi:MFS family permease
MIIYKIVCTTGYSILAVAINASVPKSMRGTLNGLVMLSGSLGNALGPICGSYIFAIATSYKCNWCFYGDDDDFCIPFDGRVVFHISAVGMIVWGFACKRYLKDNY